MTDYELRITRLHNDLVELISDKGVTLTPKGVALVIVIAASINKDGPPMMHAQTAIDLADEFMRRWAKERDGAPHDSDSVDKFFAPPVPEIKIQ